MAFLTRLFRPSAKGEEVFSQLIGPHISSLHRMAWHWTRNQQDAEDLVQDVLIRVVNRTDEMARIEKLRPWLLRIMYNRYVDLFRSRGRSPLHNAEEFDEFSSVTDDQHNNPEYELAEHQQLAAALQQLNPDQRDVVLLHDVEGYTALEVAETLDISVGTVKSRLHRSREKLKEFLTTMEPSGHPRRVNEQRGYL